MRDRALCIFVISCAAIGSAVARTPTADEQRAAELAIAKLRHEWTIGSGPFDARRVADSIEARIHRRAEVAPPDRAALELEWARIRSATRFPDRLGAIEAALGHDRDLLLEVFVRPVLETRGIGGFGADPRGGADDTWSAGVLDDGPTQRGDHSAVWTGSSLIVWGGVYGPSDAVLSTGFRYDPVADAWFPVTDVGAPAARSRHTAVWTGSKMLIWGGFFSRSDGAAYDPATDTWSPITSVGAPAGRHEHSAVWTGSTMLVFGGTGTAGALGDGGSYDPVANSWSPLSLVDAPAPRSGHTAVWTGAKMIVWGGSELATGGVYDPAADTWTSTSTTGAPSGRTDHVAAWTGARMLVWGGGAGTGSVNSGGAYDPVADSWTATSVQNAPLGRRDPAAAWADPSFVVWGGGLSNTGGRYDPAWDTWTPISPVGAPAGRGKHTGTWTGSRFIVFGGEHVTKAGPGDKYTNGGGLYDPVADTWRALMPPAGRNAATLVWTGTQAIAWGGIHRVPYGDGGRYDPLVDAWFPVSPVGAPSARQSHSAVWTGSEMVIFGGERASAGTFVGDGAAYDPEADTWRSISLTGAPAPRARHLAAWTGRQMIVWGGSSAATANDGARYDPALDAWLPLTAGGGPGERYNPQAVWTGSRLFVWGGTDPFGVYLQTGSLYDPEADVWSATTLVGAPSARSLAAIVWTGRRVVVWGGRGNAGMSAGGRYDPTANTWESLSAVSAPALVEQATAVWTGGRMIVWGGILATGGGRYDPVQDQWSTLSTPGQPSPPNRTSHRSLWTGEEMLVWGGQAGPYSLGDGSLYRSAIDTDGDGSLDQHDCDPWDPTHVSLPGPATSLGFLADRVTLDWVAASGAASHDLSRGDLSTLRAGGALDSCLAQGVGTSHTDPAVPAPDAGFVYVVRGRNGCGAGSWGSTAGACP